MFRRIIFILAVLLLPAASFVRADDTAEPDWSTWRHLPVFDRGRLMPLDTFARAVVEKICGRTSVNLRLSPNEKPRKFTAAELLFSWLVEAEKWERVPFLHAEHEQLRTELLGLPIADAKDGRRLKYVSPRQLESARKFRLRLGELLGRQRKAQADGKRFRPSGVDKRVLELASSHRLYRLLTLRLVPALSPAALEAGRDTSDDAQPWLSLKTLIFGSGDVLHGYPQPEVQAVRKAFDEAKAAYVDRDNPTRKQRFTAAMDRFATAIRSLGEKIEPLRRRLPIREKDEELFALTAYPAPGYTDIEVQYNQSNPFFWSWVVSLGAVVCFALSFGVIRRPMFWLGVLVLAAAQVFIVYGFCLRVYITGWAPVTNMFETVVFAALVVAVLGLWFAMLPLTWPGLTASWRLAAFRRSSDTRVFAGMLLPRLALMAGVFYMLTIAEYGSGGETSVISLVPKTGVGSSIPTANALLTWGVGLCVLAAAVCYVPRIILTLLLGIGMIPYVLLKQGVAEPLKQVLARKPLTVAGAAVALLASILAYNAPVFDKDIGVMMPVLRNNFWLLIHVLSITASYGAAGLAWGLGNLSLAYYLFGRYRQPVGDGPATISREPEACATLAGFIYKAIQVAVLLLAAGTILGGLWADVSWGRFWGWDPKEVWALVSLLVYAAILHGRYAGWFGHFGLAVGSVLGATAIVMAWYGVNYVLPGGLHSYGEGTGGQLQVGVVTILNWLFVAAAAVRYNIEIRGRLILQR